MGGLLARPSPANPPAPVALPTASLAPPGAASPTPPVVPNIEPAPRSLGARPAAPPGEARRFVTRPPADIEDNHQGPAHRDEVPRDVPSSGGGDALSTADRAERIVRRGVSIEVRFYAESAIIEDGLAIVQIDLTYDGAAPLARDDLGFKLRVSPADLRDPLVLDDVQPWLQRMVDAVRDSVTRWTVTAINDQAFYCDIVNGQSGARAEAMEAYFDAARVAGHLELRLVGASRLGVPEHFTPEGDDDEAAHPGGAGGGTPTDALRLDALPPADEPLPTVLEPADQDCGRAGAEHAARELLRLVEDVDVEAMDDAEWGSLESRSASLVVNIARSLLPLPRGVAERVHAVMLSCMSHPAKVGVAALLLHGDGLEWDPNGRRQFAAPRGATYLHLAASHDNLHAVAVLLACTADPHATLGRGVTPLHFAARYAGPDTTRCLLAVSGPGAADRGSELGTPVEIAHTRVHIGDENAEEVLAVLASAPPDDDDLQRRVRRYDRRAGALLARTRASDDDESLAATDPEPLTHDNGRVVRCGPTTSTERCYAGAVKAAFDVGALPRAEPGVQLLSVLAACLFRAESWIAHEYQPTNEGYVRSSSTADFDEAICADLVSHETDFLASLPANHCWPRHFVDSTSLRVPQTAPTSSFDLGARPLAATSEATMAPDEPLALLQRAPAVTLPPLPSAASRKPVPPVAGLTCAPGSLLLDAKASSLLVPLIYCAAGCVPDGPHQFGAGRRSNPETVRRASQWWSDRLELWPTWCRDVKAVLQRNAGQWFHAQFQLNAQDFSRRPIPAVPEHGNVVGWLPYLDPRCQRMILLEAGLETVLADFHTWYVAELAVKCADLRSPGQPRRTYDVGRRCEHVQYEVPMAESSPGARPGAVPGVAPREREMPLGSAIPGALPSTLAEDLSSPRRPHSLLPSTPSSVARGPLDSFVRHWRDEGFLVCRATRAFAHGTTNAALECQNYGHLQLGLEVGDVVVAGAGDFEDARDDIRYWATDNPLLGGWLETLAYRVRSAGRDAVEVHQGAVWVEGLKLEPTGFAGIPALLEEQERCAAEKFDAGGSDAAVDTETWSRPLDGGLGDEPADAAVLPTTTVRSGVDVGVSLLFASAMRGKEVVEVQVTYWCSRPVVRHDLGFVLDVDPHNSSSRLAAVDPEPWLAAMFEGARATAGSTHRWTVTHINGKRYYHDLVEGECTSSALVMVAELEARLDAGQLSLGLAAVRNMGSDTGDANGLDPALTSDDSSATLPPVVSGAARALGETPFYPVFIAGRRPHRDAPQVNRRPGTSSAHSDQVACVARVARVASNRRDKRKPLSASQP